ncbi:TetR/AcrR family transcriptional regulator [Saccharopolyspora sp. NFXS83]|uniref:TetR/AcrR family transcriptional regulator n=1 Tax=Saccharopolyspora sp. NFXS83 TaxID=2993560 RepID=UPI00224B642C|nr:TetR/AcrR family transcriptional regulator [Saccharopolyspora sp. NFXS83]MCX2730802.1 TetR/AcrR family transcriptional regulator [Saccharopolyspora sp. NFXS83]
MARENVGGGRRYAGLAPAQRARQRRTALLDAAEDLFGTQGYRATSVKQVCTRAGLTERYFYESFRGREAALVAVYDHLVDGLRSATLNSIAGVPRSEFADRGLAAFIDFLTADERRAKIVLIEVVGVSPELEVRRHAVLTEFAALVAEMWLASGEATALHRTTAMGLVGGVNYLLVDWLHTGTPQRPAELLAACKVLFVGAKEQLS